MRRRIARLLSLIFIACLVHLFVYLRDASAQDSKSFLWRVQSKTANAYVLGSVHFLKKEMYPLHQKIENGFDRSEILVVEANINDISKMNLQKLKESAFYPENDTLEKHVSSETYELIQKELVGSGLSVQLINRQKPWFLAMTLQALELLKMGFDPNYGIDKHFLSKAEGKKKILELESFDEQIALFSRFSDTDQELFLLYTLKELKTLGQELDRLINAWVSGDAKGMESILTKSLAEDGRTASIYEKLIYERNRKMVSRIEDFLRTDKTYFVVVGAAHLVGDKGIIEILRGKGYVVEQF
jgi:uncharacterized protein